MKRVRLIQAFALLLLPLANIGQDVYTLTQTSEPVRIGNQFVFLRDTTHQMTFDEVLANGRFAANHDKVPNYDVTPDAIWGKIKLTCKHDADWYLLFNQESFNEITFYQKRGNNPWEKETQGNYFPKEHKDASLGRIDLKLDLKSGDTTLLVFKVQDFYPLQFDINIGTLDSFSAMFHYMDVYNGICFGVMIMMLIYNLYLYITNRQISYLYYVLYVFSSGVFLAVFAGYYVHLPGFLQAIIRFDPVIFPVAFGIAILLFTMQLFKGLISKTLKKVFYVFISIVVANVILGAFGFVYFAFDMIRIMGLLLGVLCIGTGIYAQIKGSTSAKFYILGFGAYLGGLTFLILSGHIIPANSLAFMAIITGSMLECVFLSFAQADKLKIFQLEKEAAQQETIVQMQKNENLVREQNVVLEHKVKERTAELAEKNKEIVDSIHYAQRIQSTLLAHETLLKQNIPDHFILFKPKDIVSGDFYWATQKDNLFYLAICDSTGHGVPGAFMSLLNITFLNEAINEKGVTKPNEVFNYVRTHLISSISRDGGRDGMDGILVCFDTSGQNIKMTYAAANNAPVLIRNGKIIDMQFDKMPVGRGEITDSFILYQAELEKGDTLYLFTDGYADQFGGPKGKKFMYRQLEERISISSNKSMPEQKEIFDSTFVAWKGNLEQIDDVLIVGIKV